MTRRFARWCLPATLLLAALLCGLRLGSHGLHMWDETRHGEVALEMLRTHDYVNYFYDGQPDDWLAKPPLGIWTIVAGYKAFGPSVWTMRLPSAVGGVLIALFTFLIVRLYRGPYSAALACFVLLTCRGIVGPHVARTGDLDGVFIATLLAALYYVLGSRRPGKGHWLIYAAVAGGLAFMTKGFAGGLIVPGLGLYGLWSGQLKRWLKSPWFYGAAVVFGAFVVGWYEVIRHYGQHFENGPYGHDAWEIMTNYDIFQRFTTKIEADDTSAWSVLSDLDVRFGPWFYLLAVSVVVLGVTKRWVVPKDDLIKASVCLAASVIGLLATSSTRFNWYIAPAVPFLSILTVEATRRAVRRARWLGVVAGLVAVGALGNQVYAVMHVSGKTLADQIATHGAVIEGARHVYATEKPTYQYVLALKFLGKTMEPAPAGVGKDSGEEVASHVRRVPAGDGYDVVLDTRP